MSGAVDERVGEVRLSEGEEALLEVAYFLTVIHDALDHLLEVGGHHLTRDLALVERDLQLALAHEGLAGTVGLAESNLQLVDDGLGELLVGADVEVRVELDVHRQPPGLRLSGGGRGSLLAPEGKELRLTGDLVDRVLHRLDDRVVVRHAGQKGDRDVEAGDVTPADTVGLHDERPQGHDGLVVGVAVPLTGVRVDSGDCSVEVERNAVVAHDGSHSSHPSLMLWHIICPCVASDKHNAKMR